MGIYSEFVSASFYKKGPVQVLTKINASLACETFQRNFAVAEPSYRQGFLRIRVPRMYDNTDLRVSEPPR